MKGDYKELDALQGKQAPALTSTERRWIVLNPRVHGEGRKRCVIAGRIPWWRRVLRWLFGI